MIYLVDPTTVQARKCDAYCKIIIKPLYGVIIWPGP